MRSQREATPAQRTQLAAHLIARLDANPRAAVIAPKRDGRERFMLFAPALVQAILEGRKTVTRRLVSPAGAPAGACPFGVAGDRLWVREKWGHRDDFFDRQRRGVGPFVYAADGPPAGSNILAWRPSLHMPRAACRVVLDITASRAERLTQITAAGAVAEGCPASARDPIDWFRALWDRLCGGSANAWAADPWVWVIEFRARRGGKS